MEVKTLITTRPKSAECIFQYLDKQNSDIEDLKHAVQDIRNSIAEIKDILLHQAKNQLLHADVDTVFAEPNTFPNLPLSENEQLINLENEITADRRTNKLLVNYLSYGIVCTEMKAVTLHIMKRLMKRTLAIQYSCLGRKGKRAFSKYTTIFNAVIAAVQLKCPDIEKQPIIQRIGQILATSGDWEGRRKERRRSAMIKSTLIEHETFVID